MNKNYIFNNVRISLLKDKIIRFEFSPSGNFTNDETLFIKAKKESIFNLNINEDNEIISFEAFYLLFTFNKNNPLETLKVYKGDKLVYSYKFKKNTGELPLPNKTPYIFPVMDTPRLILPKEGYVEDNSGYVYEKDCKDLFLLICENDFKSLRKEYIFLTGNNEMIRNKQFGLFHSRYFRHTDKSARNMIEEYNKHGLPLDNFVLDTDWRKSELHEGCGYDVDNTAFKDISEFFHYAHQHNVEVMMNDHPLPLNKTSKAIDSEEIKYRRENLTNFFALGLDSWWYDRNWTSHLNSISKRIPFETLGTYIFHDVTDQFYKGLVLDPEVYVRPVVLSNISNIVNGNYLEITDTRLHRYAFQWSGDISCSQSSLTNEVSNMIKCSNNMIAYYSSDIGGHMGEINKSEYIRWYQYGCFSPILRPHCQKGLKKYREPWVYDKKTLEICKNYTYIRYRLLNTFVTNGYKNYYDGLGIVKPLYFLYPEERKAYKDSSSYFLGDYILVNPLGGSSEMIVPKKYFVKPINVRVYNNMNLKDKCDLKFNLKTIDLFAEKNKKLFKNYAKTKQFSAILHTSIRFPFNANLYIENDDGAKVFINNELVYDDWNSHSMKRGFIKKLKKGEVYKLKIHYYQDINESGLKLYYSKVVKSNKVRIYLPKGEWFNVTHRNVYQGNRYIKEKYKINELPLFVKAGALIPLYRKPNNISLMSLKDIVYDYYTSKTNIVEDYFYEDDGTTTGYKVGVNRINKFKTEFIEDAYVISLFKSENNLDDRLEVRNAFFKVHVRDNETIDKVLINDNEIRFKRHDHNRKVLPFLDNEFASDSKTLVFKFKQSIKEDYIIKLLVRK